VWSHTVPLRSQIGQERRAQNVCTIARFEGGDRDWDVFAADVGETMRSGGQGTPFERAADAAKRMMLLVDRESNQGANLILCETEDDLRRSTLH
jgi:hypothetical protein